MRKSTGIGYLFAIISAVIYGSMPLMAKYIYADGVTPMTLVFLRNALSIVPLGILAYREHKTLKIPVKSLPMVALIAVCGCIITPTLLLSSYEFIPSSTATVFHFAYPAVVVLAGIVFLKRRVQWMNLLCVLLCVAGIGLFYTPQQSLSLTGSVLALSSALSFAAYVVLLSCFDSRQASGFLFGFYVAVISSIGSLVLCLATRQLVFPTATAIWGLCALFSLLVTTGAVVLFQQSTFIIGGERASILSTLEPITGVMIGCFVFHEPLNPRTVFGSALVIAAALLIAVMDLKNAQKQQA